MLYVIIDGVEILVNKNLNSETNEMNIETLKSQITELERAIEDKQGEICTAQSNIETFEYDCSESEFDEVLDDCHETYNLGGMTFYPSDILKACDPIAYRCSKSDYESNYDLDSCEEYTDMVEQLESLNNDLESLQGELSDLTDELDNLKSEENIVITYKENGNESFMYFHADNEEHAIEQFNEFFKDYDGNIELVHCGYIVG